MGCCWPGGLLGPLPVAEAERAGLGSGLESGPGSCLGSGLGSGLGSWDTSNLGAGMTD